MLHTRDTRRMEWVAALATLGVVVLVGVVVAVMVWLLNRHGQAARAALLADGTFGADALDLDAVLREVHAEEADSRRRLIAVHLDLLRSHRVPLRRIYASPGRAVARLGFADGTVLLARSYAQGDLPTVVRLQQYGGLVVSEYADHPDGLTIHMTSNGGACRLVAVGLDQAD